MIHDKGRKKTVFIENVTPISDHILCGKQSPKLLFKINKKKHSTF